MMLAAALTCCAADVYPVEGTVQNAGTGAASSPRPRHVLSLNGR